jgi:hypothetical protein
VIQRYRLSPHFRFHCYTHYCPQSSLVVSWQRIHSSLTVTAEHINSSLHSLIPFFPSLLNHLRLPTLSILCCNCTTSELDSILSRYIASGRPPQKTPLPLLLIHCCRGLPHRCVATRAARTTENTALLLRASASAGMCYLAMNYFGFKVSWHNIKL